MAKDPKEWHGQKVHDAHALAIGKVVIAWNDFQESLGELFAELFGKQRWKLAAAAWQALDSDRAQRDMLLAVAAQKLGDKSAAYKSIQWIVQESHKTLSNGRNFAVHTPIIVLSDPKGSVIVTTNVLLGNRRAIAKHNKDLIEAFYTYEAQIRKMLTYVIGIRFHISNPRKHSLPQKPQLQLLSLAASPTALRH